jgi:hypothetical protein
MYINVGLAKDHHIIANSHLNGILINSIACAWAGRHKEVDQTMHTKLKPANNFSELSVSYGKEIYIRGRTDRHRAWRRRFETPATTIVNNIYFFCFNKWSPSGIDEETAEGDGRGR